MHQIVGLYQAVGGRREETGAQVVNYLGGAMGLGSNLGAKADERLAQPGLH